MSSPMPDFADPWRLCTQGKAYQGSLALADLPRLHPLLADVQGVVRFELRFGRAQDQRPVVGVRVSSMLNLRCQRCMGIVPWPVESEARLGVVSGPDEAALLPEGLEPVLVEDQRLEMRALIEDELILAVPVAPMHAAEQCAVDLGAVNAEADTPAQPAARAENPFAVLAGLHDDDKRN